MLKAKAENCFESQSERLSNSDSSLITAPVQWRPGLGGASRRLELLFKLDTLRIPGLPQRL